MSDDGGMKTRSTLRRNVKGQTAALGLRRAVRGVPTQAPTLARISGVGPAGEPFLDLPSMRRTGVQGQSIVPLGAADVGADAMVEFLDGDAARPVVIGLLRHAARAPAPRPDAIVDGQRIVLTGDKEIVLRCGKASIALSADGTVVIKGARLLSSAAGLHRIRGAAVQIN